MMSAILGFSVLFLFCIGCHLTLVHFLPREVVLRTKKEGLLADFECPACDKSLGLFSIKTLENESKIDVTLNQFKCCPFCKQRLKWNSVNAYLFAFAKLLQEHKGITFEKSEVKDENFTN